MGSCMHAAPLYVIGDMGLAGLLTDDLVALGADPRVLLGQLRQRLLS